MQERVLEEKVVKRLRATARTRADLVRHDHLRNAAGRELLAESRRRATHEQRRAGESEESDVCTYLLCAVTNRSIQRGIFD